MLEDDLKKTKAQLADKEMSSQELRKEIQELAISYGHVEIDRNKIVKDFIPEMVRRLLNSYEYKKALAEPFNLYSQSGFIDGVHVGREPEEARRLLEDVEDLDLEAGEKYQSLYDQLFTRDYPYVQKIRSTNSRKFEELMNMYPDPAPSLVETTIASEPVVEPRAEESSHPNSPPKDPSGSVFV